jgi:DNA-directed RNA polymerase subunit E'/Rpb7
MSTKMIIEQKVCIEPEFLDKNLKMHLLNKLKKNFANQCNKEYGYILEVNKILSIKDNYISSNCEHIFIINVEIESLKPEINKLFVGTTCMIFSGGIFLIIKNKLKVLIPVTVLEDYIFDQNNNCYINKKDKKLTIQNGNELKIIITGIRYLKQNFSCFGKLA